MALPGAGLSPSRIKLADAEYFNSPDNLLESCNSSPILKACPIGETGSIDD